MTTERRPSRRCFLAGVATGAAGLAGCTGGSADNPTGESGPEPLDSPPSGPPVLGDPEAAVTLEVFEDFNCPHCQDYNAEGFPEIRSAYLESNQIRYVHRDLPFIDPTSWQAASAAREVYRSYGRPFWSYKSALMSEGPRIQSDAPGVFGEVADAEGLDSELVQQAGANRKHDQRLSADRSRAERLGIPGTPGFVVDGEVVETLADARGAIDKRLE